MIGTETSRGLHRFVVEEIGRRIVRGEYAVGERIDLEAITSDLNVSRTVLRESIKVLTEKGLIEARPRLGTLVTDRSCWRMLDSDVLLWRTTGNYDHRLVAELGELREIFEPPAAGLAAIRADVPTIGRIAAALDRMTIAEAASDSVGVAQADVEFHRAILAGAGNELLEQFEVLLEPALRARNILTLGHTTDQHFLEQHAAVYRAITDADAHVASTVMRDLMHIAAQDAARVLKHDQQSPANSENSANECD